MSDQKIVIRSRGGITKVLIDGRQIDDIVSLSLEQDADKAPGSLGDPVLTLKIRVWDLWVDSDNAKIETVKATPADGAEDLT